MPDPSFDFKKRLRPKTYSVAIYVVALFILVEAIVFGSIFWFRYSVVTIESDAPIKDSAGNSVKATMPERISINNLPNTEVTGRLTMPQPGSAEAKILEFNQQAREFRRQNDFALAEAALQRALELDPEHPNTLVNLAMLEEARGNNEKALKYWQSIVNLGAKAETTIRLAQERISVIEERMKQEKLAREREEFILHTPRKILVDRIVSKPSPIPDKPAEIQFDFILKTNQENLDSGKLRVQVFLYDRLSNNDLVRSKVDAHFLSRTPRFTTNTTETLRVRYLRSMQGGDEQRNYYGYLLRVIYDGEVQDERADPSDLINIFPYNPQSQPK